MICPVMEYTAVVWDPYYQTDTQHLEKVQRRAARWVLNNFSRCSSITNMLQQLSWPSLQVRHKICRLQTLFKIIHNEYSLSIPSYYLEMERATRQYHLRRYILPTSSTNIFQQSFYFRSIRNWSALPPRSITLTNLLMKSSKFISPNFCMHVNIVTMFVIAKFFQH